ncbi:MAG: glycosyltransferase family 2 protein [Candidatus Nanoarchaeia archaeon]
MKEKVSCIIPVYNEEKRVLNVLNVVATHKLINEIIVVDDNSEDNTLKEIKDFIRANKPLICSIKIIKKRGKRGKASSLYMGFNKARGDYLFMIDGDLKGLTSDNISELILPVLCRKVDVGYSLRNTLFIHNLLGIDVITGEKIFHKNFFHNLPECRNTGFGIEVVFNEYFIKHHKKIGVVKWPNVTCYYKTHKKGFVLGIMDSYKMMQDIFKIIPWYKFIYQTIYLAATSKKLN